MDLDQLNEKLKETSNMTREIACRILDRVREFQKNFSGWDTVTTWGRHFHARSAENGDVAETIAKKVYHRQPKRHTAAAAKKSGPKNASVKKKSSSKGRAKRKK